MLFFLFSNRRIMPPLNLDPPITLPAAPRAAASDKNPNQTCYCKSKKPRLCAINPGHFICNLRRSVAIMATPPSPSPSPSPPPPPPSLEEDPHAEYRASIKIAISQCHKLQDLNRNSPKLSPNLRPPIKRLIQAELDHLSRRLFSPDPTTPLCPNFGYLSALCHVIHHPSIQFVSGVFNRVGSTTHSTHVDIMCCFRGVPTWVFVSDRNPTYVTWVGSSGSKDRGLRDRVETAIAAANEAGSLRPDKLLYVFARGLEKEVRNKFLHELGAVESDFADGLEVVFDEMDDEWVGISDDSRRLLDYKAFEIQIGEDSLRNEVSIDEILAEVDLDLGHEFDSSTEKPSSCCDGLRKVINFDTTALIAIVSGISNGEAKKLLEAPPEKMREKYKPTNYEFFVKQAKSELERPFLQEVKTILAGKKGIICQSVLEEFDKLVSICGGPAEKHRAEDLLKRLVVVPDNPSKRVLNLQSTRKVNAQNKVIFGTGDHWHAPTLTAKEVIVRAIVQTGMPLLAIVHRPLALIGL